MQKFRDIDLWIEAQGIEMKSVDTSKEVADSFFTIGRYLNQLYPDYYYYLECFSAHLFTFIKAQLHHFPENIFWDYNYFCCQIFRSCLTDENPVQKLEFSFQRLVKLLEVFGKESNICFRYMHDFLFGFDWAKWVRKSPNERQSVNPFDLQFLDYLTHRAKELEVLIAENDKKYNQIENGEFRNPFFFSRSPKDETRLLQSLATDGLIPVHIWEFDCTPNWFLSFSKIREERAIALAMPTN